MTMRLRLLPLFAAASMLLASCGNNDTLCNYHFYTSEDPQSEQWELWIDGQSLRTLPNPISNPDCDQPNQEFSSLIQIALDGKKHRFEAIDGSGTVRSSGFIKQDENSMSVSGNKGGAGSQGDCSCTLVEVFA